MCVSVCLFVYISFFYCVTTAYNMNWISTKTWLFLFFLFLCKSVSAFLSIYLSICLSFCRYFCLFFYVYFCLYIFMSVFISNRISDSFCLSFCLSVFLAAYLYLFRSNKGVHPGLNIRESQVVFVPFTLKGRKTTSKKY